jgi:phage FluMu protein Com
MQDNHPKLVIQKCTQVGVSFTVLLKSLYLGDQANLSIIYTLPTSGDVKDFVLSKFDPVLESSDRLKAKVKRDPFSRRTVYSTVLKRIGDSHYFFRGSFSEHKAQTIDADLLIVDELDFQKPEVRKQYEERLGGSASLGMIYWLGVPTLPNFGIAELFQESDQRYWYIRCPHCKQLQTLDWPQNISFQRKEFICKFCRKILSNDDRKKGKWIAKFPGRETHGYYINRLMAPWIPASRIIKSFHDETPKHFYNFSLGVPYLEKSSRFSKEDFTRATVTEVEYQTITKQKRICGIDQGNNFNVISGYANPKEAIVTDAKLFFKMDALEKYLEEGHFDLFVMDMFPDQHYAKKLQEKYGKNKFYMANLRLWGREAQQSWMEIKRSEGIINLERTESLDHLMESIKNTSVRFRYATPNLEDILTHLRNTIPDYQERFGKKRKVYKKIGKDDYAHALNYFLAGCNFAFPNIGPHPSRIVPAVIAEDDDVGSKKWFQKDFEREIFKVKPRGDYLHIPPLQ